MLGGVLGKLERPRVGASPNRLGRNLVLCTSVVGPYLFIPPIVLFVTGVLRGIREARLPPIGAG